MIFIPSSGSLIRAEGRQDGGVTLIDQLPPTDDPDALFEAFSSWTETQGITLYPAQEEALIEVVSGSNVILSTPTGSGKSLVAVGAHFVALAEGRRSFYTAPIKALVSEKFFDLCATFGTDNGGMMTGDASVNAGAPIICCTAEVLANIALRNGAGAGVGQVVMHETLEELLSTHQAPVYVVHFTQAAAVERAQSLMSVNVCTRAEKDAIADLIG